MYEPEEKERARAAAYLVYIYIYIYICSSLSSSLLLFNSLSFPCPLSFFSSFFSVLRILTQLHHVFSAFFIGSCC